jgi:hypothetical protein
MLRGIVIRFSLQERDDENHRYHGERNDFLDEASFDVML